MIERVVIEIDAADGAEVAEWRAEMLAQGDDAGHAALEAHDRGDLVLGTVYVETAFGPDEDDVAALTLDGVEFERGRGAAAQSDDALIGEALAQSAAQLADEQGLQVTGEELRAVLSVQASAALLEALGRA
jgi:hypothetical protein